MPNRFPTEAANADTLDDDPGAIRGRAARPPRFTGSHEGRKEVLGTDSESKPGKDINQPGFIKDKE